MNRVAIEIDDVALVVQVDDDSPPLSFPSVALVREGGLSVGDEAEQRRRLEPRRIHDDFWYELSTEALRRPYPGGFSTADLAHAHLELGWRARGSGAEETLLAVPGDLSQEKLGLILGIAHAAGVPVTGLVDAALAATVDHGSGGPSIHLEVFRNRVVATVLDHRETSLFRQATEIDETIGLLELETRWARSLAAEFVKATRFDPLDRAESEQVLHEQLPTWLNAARRRGAIRIEMTVGELVHSVDISERLFVDSAETTYHVIDRLVDGVRAEYSCAQLFLGHRAAALPRLADRLRRATGLEVSSLPMAAAANGALRHAGAIVSESGTVAMVVELAAGGRWQLPLAKPSAPAPVVLPAAGSRPTHVLHNGLAYQIPPSGLVVGIAPPAGPGGLALVGTPAGVSRRHLSIRREGGGVVVEDHSRYGTQLNEVRLEGVAAVVAGDRLSVGSPGIVLELIATVDGDGTP